MTIMDDISTRTEAVLRAESSRVAHNYHPLDVVVATGAGAVLTDVDGTEYLDFLAAYSATNFGHGHPALVAAARQQLDRVTLTSRAFHHDQLAAFADGLTRLVDKDMMLPMNTGAEAVESAIKVARAWGYLVKGVPTAAPRSSWPAATSTAAPPRSSASPTTRWPMITSVRTHRASSLSRTATSTRWPRR
jgi:ornithine--oxo-acid transaminase